MGKAERTLDECPTCEYYHKNDDKHCVDCIVEKQKVIKPNKEEEEEEEEEEKQETQTISNLIARFNRILPKQPNNVNIKSLNKSKDKEYGE